MRMEHARITIACLLLSSCFLAHEELDVSDQDEYGVAGLWTNPNPATGAPAGALLRAEEVDFVRPNAAQPRPGFKADTSSTGLDHVDKLIPYDGAYLRIGTISSTRRTEIANTAITDGSAALQWTANQWRAVESRKNLYLTTSDAVRKITSASATTATMASMPSPTISATLFASPSPSGPVLPGDTVAYRATFSRTDANNVTVTSSPSIRLLWTDGGTGIQLTLHVYWNPNTGIVAGDVVKIYRSLNSTVTSVPDELFLSLTYTLTSADISAGSVDLLDYITDANLGAALYTNSSQESIARQNVQPPVATDTALYRGSVFLANLTYPHLIDLSWLESGQQNGSASGVGYRFATNATITNNSSTATLNAGGDSTGWQVGMIITTNKGDHWSARPVTITSVSGATIGLSATWIGTTGTATITAYDTIKIVGSTTSYYPIGYATWLVNAAVGFGSNLADMKGLTASADVTVSSSSDSNTSNASKVTVRIQRLLPSTGSFAISATHGDQFLPAIPLISSGTSTASTRDTFANGITWSKQDEPEHFMAGQIWLVGNAKSPILRIVPTQDALWVLKGKGDGIYRLSGFGELSGWRVDPFDSSTYLLHPELAVVHNNTVYAWTNRGAVRIDDSGVVPINDPINDQTRDLQQQMADAGDGSGPRAFSVSNVKDDEIIFGLPSSSNASSSGAATTDTYVYRVPDRRWAKWFVGLSGKTTMAYDTSTRLLALGLSTTGAIRLERDPTATVRFADLEYAITINTVVSQTITIAAASGWTPAVGDLLVRSSSFFVVTAITSATVFTVHTTGCTTGSATGYVAYSSHLSWLPRAAPSGASQKRFLKLTAHWEDTEATYGWAWILSGSRNQTSTTELDYTRDYQRTNQIREDSRVITPQSCQLANQLFPELVIRQADSRWRFTGITIDSVVVSTVASL